MITFKSLGNFGRLGNQIFQYAVLKKIADTNGFKYGIPINCELRNCFKIECESSDNVITDYKYNENFSDFSTYKEEVFKSPDNTDFVGYFQSYKYIPDNFKLPFKINYNSDISKNCIGIHVRRTDYVGNNFNKEQPIEYYTDAMKLFGVNYNYYMISDDIEWCKKNFKQYDNIIFSTNNTSYEDLYYFAQCQHQIISASTFSWWGAWLNENPNKLVVYPYYWLHGDHMGTVVDLIPKGWVPISTN